MLLKTKGNVKVKIGSSIWLFNNKNILKVDNNLQHLILPPIAINFSGNIMI